jgi:hypothetical protein
MDWAIFKIVGLGQGEMGAFRCISNSAMPYAQWQKKHQDDTRK